MSKTIFRGFIHAVPEIDRPRNHFVFWISLLLAELFLYLALRKLDWQAFVLTLQNADYVYLPLIFLWGSPSYLLRALRW